MIEAAPEKKAQILGLLANRSSLPSKSILFAIPEITGERELRILLGEMERTGDIVGETVSLSPALRDEWKFAPASGIARFYRLPSDQDITVQDLQDLGEIPPEHGEQPPEPAPSVRAVVDDSAAEGRETAGPLSDDPHNESCVPVFGYFSDGELLIRCGDAAVVLIAPNVAALIGFLRQVGLAS